MRSLSRSPCFLFTTLLALNCWLEAAVPFEFDVGPCDGPRASAHIVDHGGMSRRILLHVPRSVCERGQPAPIVYGIHCFESAANETNSLSGFWEPMFDKYGMILVLPEGYNKSWSAEHCCGSALEHGLDDAQYLTDLHREVTASLGALASTLAFAFGKSNGAYMASLVAMHPRNPYAAVALIAGYQYRDVYTAAQPVAMLQVHSTDDPYVLYRGCCEAQDVTAGGLTPCCCGIPEASPPTCTSASDHFRRWGTQVNGCDESSVIVSREALDPELECVTMSSGCRANATLCSYSDQSHFELGTTSGVQREFPLKNEVLDFFAREVCSRAGVPWDEGTLRCRCEMAIEHEGFVSDMSSRYCLASASDPNVHDEL